ncbi:hypothetical protein FB451DRAFT_1170710 [Mycena latifolia]|nr:hypothetical protein FB451DRAFT_1170710 [Mycena latifolia]
MHNGPVCAPTIFDDGLDHAKIDNEKGLLWWAVFNGRAPGLYTNYYVAEEQINGFSSAKWRRFATKALALAYWADCCRHLHDHTGEAEVADKAEDNADTKKSAYHVVGLEGSFSSFEEARDAACDLIYETFCMLNVDQRESDVRTKQPCKHEHIILFFRNNDDYYLTRAKTNGVPRGQATVPEAIACPSPGHPASLTFSKGDTAALPVRMRTTHPLHQTALITPSACPLAPPVKAYNNKQKHCDAFGEHPWPQPRTYAGREKERLMEDMKLFRNCALLQRDLLRLMGINFGDDWSDNELWKHQARCLTARFKAENSMPEKWLLSVQVTDINDKIRLSIDRYIPIDCDNEDEDELTILQGSTCSPEERDLERRKRRYVKRFPLVNPLTRNLSHNDARFKASWSTAVFSLPDIYICHAHQEVLKYMHLIPPVVPDALNVTKSLFRRIKDDDRLDRVGDTRPLTQPLDAGAKRWMDDGCPVCMGEKGPAPNIILACACHHTAYHLACIRQWHWTKDAQALVVCITCNELTKPINLEWLQMSPQERAHNNKTSHTGERGKCKNDPFVKATEARRKRAQKERRQHRIDEKGKGKAA